PDRLRVGAGHLDGVLQPALEVGVLEGSVGGGYAPDPVWIRRDESLGENDHVGTIGGCLPYQRGHLGDRRLPIQVRRSRLYGCDLHAAAHPPDYRRPIAWSQAFASVAV